MIFPAEISKLSSKTGISDKTIEKDYILTWILIGLSSSGLKDNLVFKGGTALRKIYIKNYRYSEDLDFTLINHLPKGEILQKFETIYDIARKSANIPMRFNRREEEQEDSLTFYVNYSGPLGASLGRNEIKIDVTLKELLQFPTPSLSLLREYSDQPDDIEVKTYSLKEIAIEKVCSLLSSYRKEPRDVYDLWYLLKFGLVDPAFLAQPFEAKCEFKNLDSGNLKAQLDAKGLTYKKLWDQRLRDQVAQLPHFEQVYRETRRYLRGAKLI
ncbi:MAG: nucleotidyl transferase AbiEii/AbiGii toxin family protein [Actinomycetota bacterium]|nr:nucleotidyl transferase AbiEii/AbiGii toxin family protein [Actinomycetota bacterium]